MTLVINCIKKEAVCFEDIESIHLEKLVERCKDKRIVLIGESTHGSAEYYRMRARITQELISKAGFSIVACEGDWADFEEADRYVRGHPLRATPFQRFPSWMWRNQHFFRFLETLRSYKDVRLYGLDLYGMSRNIESLHWELQRKAPNLAAQVKEKLGALHAMGIEPSGYHRFLKRGGASFQGAVQELLSVAEATFNPSDDSSFHILQNLRYLQKAEEAVRQFDHFPTHWNVRARQMYDGLQAVLNHHGPESKAIVWVHNTHVSHSSATGMDKEGLCNIGTLCKEHYQELAYTIGFGCYQGNVVAATHWEGPHEIKEIPPAHPDSYDHLFYETGLKQFSLYLQGEVKEHLRQKRLFRGVGTIYNPDPQGNYSQSCLTEQFDEYIWFHTTSPVTTITRE